MSTSSLAFMQALRALAGNPSFSFEREGCVDQAIVTTLECSLHFFELKNVLP